MQRLVTEFDAQGRLVQMSGEDGSFARISWEGELPAAKVLEFEGEEIMRVNFQREGSVLVAEVQEEGIEMLRMEMSLDAQGRLTEVREMEYEDGGWVTIASETYVWEGANVVRSQTVMDTGGRGPQVWMNLYTYDENPNAFGGQGYGIIMLANGAIGQGFAGYGSANNLIAHRQRDLEAPVDIRSESAALAAAGSSWEDTDFEITYGDHHNILRLIDPQSGMMRDFEWRCE